VNNLLLLFCIEYYPCFMSRSLIKEEKYRVRQAVEDCGKSVQKLQTSEELHQFAMRWNWDDSPKPLFWVVRQPYCDQGTALLLYWRASPEWYCQFENRDDVADTESEQSIMVFDLITEIEKHYLSGDYTNRNISFDPNNDEGQSYVKDYEGASKLRNLPKEMMQASPGVKVERQDLYDIIIRLPTDIEQKKIEKCISNGLNVLKGIFGSINDESDVQSIVFAIRFAVDAFRLTHGYSPKITEDEPLLDLGWLWADQLCRAYEWKWMAWDVEGKARLGVFSPDQIYISFPPNLVNYHLDVTRQKNKISDLFISLGKIERTQQFSEAYGSGWLTLNPYSVLFTKK
jgi:hypothetical protein